MKGIILAGGSGTRLYPLTKCVSKQLLPVYDKPAIYYPLSTLMLAGIRDILIISTERDLPLIRQLFGSGEEYGLNLQYCVQEKPNGLAEAFILGKDFIGKDTVALVLGDNLIYGDKLVNTLQEATKLKKGAIVFGYKVNNPSDFAIVEFDTSGSVITIEEKPNNPKSDYAVPGLYFYDNDVVKIAENVKPSERGELEITSINQEYLAQGTLSVSLLGRGIAWMDVGSYDSLLDAGNFVAVLQKKQGYHIACIEEIALRMGYIGVEQLKKLSEKYNPKTSYGKYLQKLIGESR